MAKKNNMMKNATRMARAQQAREKAEREKTYNEKVWKLRLFPLLSLVMALVLLLLFFMNWAYVFNTDSGTEVSVTGFNCLVSGISGNYEGTESSIGDMAMPFYYYAKAESVTLSSITVATFFVLLAMIVAFALALIKNKEYFVLAGLVLGVALTGLLFVSNSVALSMKGAKILSGYCDGNVKCSIRSEAILPALLSLFSLALPVTEIIRRALLKKTYLSETK
ncbi:MAG: hypothetical protein IJU10_03560 [Clostridia bacterium]|nr:hypothetical protein [Clostridia bacterium]